MAGVGLAHSFKQGSTPAGASDTNFAWLLGAGATLALNNKTRISGEYNWVRNTESPYTDTIQPGRRGTIKDTGANVFSIRWNHSF